MLQPGIYKIFFAVLVSLLNCSAVFGQDAAPSPSITEPKIGSVNFTAQVEINGKTEKLDRKRFYLIRGGRQQHAEFLKQIAETPVTSRDCYYAGLLRNNRKISDNLFCWLKNNDCETPYCREVKTKEEALSVPEFAVAYNQGLREYGRPVLALKWLTTNLPDNIRDGFYQQQKPIMRQLIDLAKSYGQEATRAKKGSARPGEGFQSIMTNRLGNAYFLDVEIVPPANKKTETYLVTNLMPMVFGDTSYIWTCEFDLDPAKPLNKVVLKTEIGKKKCEVVTKKLTETCSLPDCSKQTEKPTT
jgi:hypothetical protein